MQFRTQTALLFPRARGNPPTGGHDDEIFFRASLASESASTPESSGLKAGAAYATKVL